MRTKLWGKIYVGYSAYWVRVVNMADDETKRQDAIKNFFQEEASRWDGMTRRYEPRYDEMLDEVLSRAILPDNDCNVLELGCGTGNLTERFLRKYPRANFICLDTSSQMLQLAAAKLESFPNRVEFLESNFSEMPEGPFHAVISSLALHHIPSDNDKKIQYAQIYKSLYIGGCFWNADITLCGSDQDSLVDEANWVEWLKMNDFSQDQITTIIERSHINDRPAKLVDQLLWLREIGFKNTDCTWRYMGYSVYGGWK